ncbi:MAG: NAD(P)/FAD-dependent oxidoreductase [Pseudomonadota bacterium]
MSDDKDKMRSPLDVLIIGAGVSGIGMAAYLTRELPNKRYAIIESRNEIGGTWDLFRYPGIRSDSDLFTFAFDFKPWASENSIASAEEIMTYLREVVAEYEIAPHITFEQQVTQANWDSGEGLWRVSLRSTVDGSTEEIRCRWLFGATGYYDYEQGFRPAFPNEAEFAGQLFHAQHWPEDVDVRGKNVSVIGSGATAMTLVPALAEQAKKVNLVQRTPTYVVPLPKQDMIANLLRKVLPNRVTHKIIRWRNTRLQRFFYWLYQKYPNIGRRQIRRLAMKHLPKDYPYDVHFNPPYGPWDQRICVVPDGDLFSALNAGKARMVTGKIERLTEKGIALASGESLPSDIIVLATGLNIKVFGGIVLSVDGERVDPSKKRIYRGMMLDGIPNFAVAMGYTNSSWTLKVCLVCEYLCRLLREMDKRDQDVCVVEKPNDNIDEKPFMDFAAGYVQRSLHMMPRQGTEYPWIMSANYLFDAKKFRDDPVVGEEMLLSSVSAANT